MFDTVEMSKVQLSLLKRLADCEEFNSLETDEEFFSTGNPREANVETSLRKPSPGSEKTGKGSGPEPDRSGNSGVDSDDDGSSSVASSNQSDDETKNSSSEPSPDSSPEQSESSSGSSAKRTLKDQSVSPVLDQDKNDLVKDEPIEKQENPCVILKPSEKKQPYEDQSVVTVSDPDEASSIVETTNIDLNHKGRKSVSFDSVSKSQDALLPVVGGSGSKDGEISQGNIPDLLAVPPTAPINRKKMTRQENIHPGTDEGDRQSKPSNDSCIGAIESSPSVNPETLPRNNPRNLSISAIEDSPPVNPETFSKNNPRNLSISAIEDSPPVNPETFSKNNPRNLSISVTSPPESYQDNSSSKTSALKEGRQRTKSRWGSPVSIEERLERNYQELRDLMTRDIEVRGEARQLVHAFQMEQLYESYVSVSHGFVRPSYVIPRSALSSRRSMRTTNYVKSSRDSQTPLKLKNRASAHDSQRSRPLSSDRVTGNSVSSQFVDHRLGHSTNPNILKWLNDKNQKFWKQKKEEKVQKRLERETKRLEMLIRAERKLQSQQVVNNWMQQKFKAVSASEKNLGRKKMEAKTIAESLSSISHDALADKTSNKNGRQICSSKLADDLSKTKLKQLKDTEPEAKITAESSSSISHDALADKTSNKNGRQIFSSKLADDLSKSKLKQLKDTELLTPKGGPQFKSSKSDLSYDAWTRQAASAESLRTASNRASPKEISKSQNKAIKDQEKGSTFDSDCLGKEKENINFEERHLPSPTNEGMATTKRSTLRPKTARGPRSRMRPTTSSYPNRDVANNTVEKLSSETKGVNETLSSGTTQHSDKSDFSKDSNNGKIDSKNSERKMPDNEE